MDAVHHLVVVHPFGDYARGDMITDPAEVEKVKQEHGNHVVKITPHPAQPSA